MTLPGEAGDLGRSWPRGVAGLAYGGDYNPEQWDANTRREDLALMREAGITLVSIGIFGWGLLEPREGEFDFRVLDETMDTVAEHGIGANLATPTASPPAWFFLRHPDAWPVTRDGRRLGFGSRGMASPHAPAYRAAIVRVASTLASRYADHPALAMWHVHNEYGNPIPESYDEHSVAAFRSWLRDRYGSLDALNRAWGTAFWGQSYHEWDDIDAPRQAATTTNPSQRLDFARFSSDSLLECFRLERDAIRQHTPDIPITTNFMSTTEPSMDLWKWAREVDVVATDHYLQAERADRHILLSMDADLTRSLGGGRPWMLMEHSTSAVNWQSRNLAKTPGEMSRNSIAHLARGADAVMFFQFRASREGAEKFHSAMLPHAGTRTRVWREVCDLGADLRALAPMRGSTVHAEVAVLWDWESMWAHGFEWRPSIDNVAFDRIVDAYTALWNLSATTDFVSPNADLSRYRLVVVPGTYLMSAATASRLDGFVRDGGVLVVGFGAAAVDENDHVHPGGGLAPLAAALGVEVDEYLPLAAGESLPLDGGGTGEIWAEDLVVSTADVRWRFTRGRAEGQPAVTRNPYGAGVGWYVATALDAQTRDAVVRDALADAGVTPPSSAAGVESVERHTARETFRTLINHADLDRVVDLGEPGIDLVSGSPTEATVRVPAGGWRVVRLGRDAVGGA